MAEFNQVMQLAAVLDRLSFGLSRFFAGDGVAIWIRASQGQFELAVKVAEDFPTSLNPHDRWVATVMAGGAGPGPPLLLLPGEPFQAAPPPHPPAQPPGNLAVPAPPPPPLPLGRHPLP